MQPHLTKVESSSYSTAVQTFDLIPEIRPNLWFNLNLCSSTAKLQSLKLKLSLAVSNLKDLKDYVLRRCSRHRRTRSEVTGETESATDLAVAAERGGRRLRWPPTGRRIDRRILGHHLLRR